MVAHVRATLDLAQAARGTWDVAVVGAGPAGSLAARELAREGLRVLLVDRSVFPRTKVCGCCLNGSALRTLGLVGLASLPGDHGAPALTRVRLAAGRSRVTLPLPAGAALSRTKFDTALVEHAKSAGADFLPEATARLASMDHGQCSVELRCERQHATVRCRILLAADGLGGRLLRQGAAFRQSVAPRSRIAAGAVVADAPAGYTTGTITLAAGAAGYVGVVRLEDGALDVAAAFDPASLRKHGPAELAARFLRECGLPELPRSDWQGTVPLTRRLVPVAAHRVFVIGDAAGYAEPFTGEGMAWALASAVHVTPLVIRAVTRYGPEVTEEWNRLHARMFGRRMARCRLLGQILRRPLLTRTMIDLLARFPVLARPVLRALNAPPHQRDSIGI